MTGRPTLCFDCGRGHMTVCAYQSSENCTPGKVCEKKKLMKNVVRPLKFSAQNPVL